MKQSIKKKTPIKKAKVQQEPVVLNGTLVGTWNALDILKITLDSGVMIVKCGNDVYRPGTEDMVKITKSMERLAQQVGIKQDKVVVVRV